MSSIHEFLKNNASSISAIFSTIAVIGGAVMYIENNFASAKDIKEITITQQQQLKVQTSQQRQLLLFQLEYYDDKLRKLQEDKRVADERVKTRSFNRAIMKSPEELAEEIADTKRRREIVQRSMIE